MPMAFTDRLKPGYCNSSCCSDIPTPVVGGQSHPLTHIGVGANDGFAVPLAENNLFGKGPFHPGDDNVGCLYRHCSVFVLLKMLLFKV